MSTILIAEQDLFLRQQLADFFRQLGHDVAEADDGVEATQQLQDHLFEVILTTSASQSAMVSRFYEPRRLAITSRPS